MLCKVYVAQDFLLSIDRFNGDYVITVQVQDFLGNSVIDNFVTLVDQNKEQIKSGHDGCSQVNVLLQ